METTKIAINSKKLKSQGKRTLPTQLPEKICPVCNRPFAWRKKWKKVWHEVIYCSERCRRNKAKAKK